MGETRITLRSSIGLYINLLIGLYIASHWRFGVRCEADASADDRGQSPNRPMPSLLIDKSARRIQCFGKGNIIHNDKDNVDDRLYPLRILACFVQPSRIAVRDTVSCRPCALAKTPLSRLGGLFRHSPLPDWNRLTVLPSTQLDL